MASDEDWGKPTLDARVARNAGLTGDAPVAVNESDLANRNRIARLLGTSYSGDRDMYETLGYTPLNQLTVDQYWGAYLRQDIARTIVDAPAATSWKEPPEIREDEENETETAWESDVATLMDDHRLAHYWERVDKVSGIGRYGILVLGMGDADDMAEPVEEGSLDGVEDLHYLAAFSEARVDDMEIATDPTNERYGLPETYDIAFNSDNSTDTEEVHWTRVIHVAEGLLESEIYGRPRLEAVWNRLQDLEKTVGGAAEMTWRGADRKLFFNVDPSMGQITDGDELAEEIENTIHGLQPFGRTRGMDVEVVGGETVDPSGIVDEVLKLISGAPNVPPKRILTGSERGELASTQDRATWLGSISERQTGHCEPNIVRATLDRLMYVGVLPPVEEYHVEWLDLFELNSVEQAEVRKTNAEALKEASPMGDTGAIAADEEIREKVLDWGPERGDETSVEIEEEELPEEGPPEPPADVPPTPPGTDEEDDDDGTPSAEDVLAEITSDD